jgi:hypothetical protein
MLISMQKVIMVVSVIDINRFVYQWSLARLIGQQSALELRYQLA